MSLAVACAAPAAHATAPAPLVAGAAASTCAAKVTISGKRVCLKTGASCQRKHESKYTSKGFTCKRNAKGAYRLKRLKQEF